MVPQRLIIGVGIHKREGWQTLDADPELHPDFVAAVPPFPAEVNAVWWDEIEWIHGIGTLYPWDAVQALKEIHALLASGGKLILEQPNFDIAKDRIEWVFGDAEQFRNPLLMNRWGYTPKTLSDLLAHVGFSRIHVLPAQHHVPARDFRIEAYR